MPFWFQDQVEKAPYQTEADAALEGGTVVEEKALILRKSGYKNAEKNKSSAQCNLWPGKNVKNFKKFKKVILI